MMKNSEVPLDVNATAVSLWPVALTSGEAIRDIDRTKWRALLDWSSFGHW